MKNLSTNRITACLLSVLLSSSLLGATTQEKKEGTTTIQPSKAVHSEAMAAMKSLKIKLQAHDRNHPVTTEDTLAAFLTLRTLGKHLEETGGFAQIDAEMVKHKQPLEVGGSSMLFHRVVYQLGKAHEYVRQTTRHGGVIAKNISFSYAGGGGQGSPCAGMHVTAAAFGLACLFSEGLCVPCCAAAAVAEMEASLCDYFSASIYDIGVPNDYASNWYMLEEESLYM